MYETAVRNSPGEDRVTPPAGSGAYAPAPRGEFFVYLELRTVMLNRSLKETLTSRVLPHVQTPAQYLGGERNMIRKDHDHMRVRLCMAFPDTYTIGMSHHGLQDFYSLINQRED